MKHKIGFAVISFILFSLVVSSESKAASNWWDKFGEPKYGGSLTVRVASLGATSFDPALIRGPQVYQWEYEPLFANDWAFDRNEWDFKGSFVPAEYVRGVLAESWKQTGPTVYAVQLRKDVHWQNKAPLNGREFVAQDVQYTYDRLLGTGSGFTEPNPLAQMMIPNIKKVIATGKYSLEFHFKQASALNVFQVLNTGPLMVAREWVEKGDLQNPENAVGTGAWMVDKFIKGASLTFKKNPDYYGYDERHPKNKLPYFNEMKVLEIQDNSTALAALRTGKVDLNTAMSIQQSNILSKTNPKIQRDFWPGAAVTLEMRCDNKPFSDINVRKAMQMAVNTKAISKMLYSGLTDGTPCGIVCPKFKGWAYTYDQWPESLKQGYSYDPDKAKKLLAAAGYPNGFKTNIVVSSAANLELVQAVKSYLKDINVDMDVKVLDPGALEPYLNAGKHDQMGLMAKVASPGEPQQGFHLRYSKGWQNYVHNNDAKYDNLYSKFKTGVSMDSVMKTSVALDKYAVEQYWAVCTGTTVDPIAWQPWIKGYSGELTFVGIYPALYYSHMWEDESLKKK